MKKIFIPLILVLLISFNNHFAYSTFYVALSGSSTAPYDTWAKAATNIQTAVDAASSGDIVLVGDGTYTLAANISVTKGITIRSANGYLLTIIDGNSATRCFFINHASAVIDGFTITNGRNLSGYGGGVQCDNGTVQNCIIENNAARDGGGVALNNSGMVINCIIRNNTADWGGGVRCFNGTVRGCLITDNTATPHGGGINIWSGGTVQNCTITNNTATDGSGIRLWNNGIVENSIIYSNSGSANYIIDAGHGNSVSYSCTTPLYTGTGNISDDPLFVNAGDSDFHLSSSSTLINAGLNAAWMNTATDLDEHNRILDATVDIGAYEYLTVVREGPIPIASWPVGNPTVYITPTLNWYLGTYAPGLTYEIQCVPASDPWLADNVYATSSTTSYTFTSALTSGVQYAWRVRSTNGITKSEWSSTALFTMVANSVGVPVVPIISWPVGNPTVYITPTLNWYLGTSAIGLTYEIQCVPDSDPWPADNVYATSSTLSYTFTSSLTNGVQYAWRVRSTNGITKSAWSATALFTMVSNSAGGPIVPITSWPMGNPTVYTTPTLNWYLGTYAPGLTYEIQCVPASDPWLADNVYATSSTLSYTFTSALTNGVQYAWRVRSTNGVTKSAWSTTAIFTMVSNSSGAPVVPFASWPIGNPTVYSTPTLNWYLGTYVPGLTYEIQCVPASDPWLADNVYATSSTLSYTFTSALTNGVQYAWRVRSTNGVTKSAWSTTALFAMISNTGGGPVVPLASWPVGNPTEYSTPTLNWYLGTYASGLTYEIQCVPASDPWLADNVYATSSTMSYTFTSSLTGGVQYAWRVRSTNGVTKSAWSTTALFTMAAINFVVQPVTGSPTNSVTINTVSPELFWYLPTATTAKSIFEVQVADNPDFQNAKTFNTDKSNMQVDGLIGGKDYFWKVRSLDETGNASYYSGTGQFKVINSVTAIEEKEVIPTRFELSQNYPNPFNPTTKISYSLPQNEFVNIKVYDMIGREVRSLVNKEMLAGNHSLEWNGMDNAGSKVASGTYIYRITTGNFIAVKKMLLLK